jgi:hypothetical protein
MIRIKAGILTLLPLLLLPVPGHASTPGDFFIRANGTGYRSQQLRYDDGTACWLTWAGLFRGVWFDVEDFGAPAF